MAKQTSKITTNQQQLIQRMQVLSELVNRVQLGAKMGISHDGARNLYDSLGYPDSIAYTDYVSRFKRQDIAAAVIDRPIKVTWRGPLVLLQSDDDKDTAFEKAWKELEARLKLKNKFIQLDKQASLGRYAVLMLGFGVNAPEKHAQPLTKGEKLEYVRVFSEQRAPIITFETDTKDPRYGLPKLYELTIQDEGQKATMVTTIKVHYSRVLHVAYDCVEGEVFGTPQLEKVYNRLMDIEKLSGGSAEMYWRGARPGFGAKIDKDYSMSKETEDDLMRRIDEYEHNLRRILMTEGIDMQTLQTQVSDPSNHLDIQVQLISAATGIPKRILTGTERGELASTQDTEHWYSMIDARRGEMIEPNIIYPFVRIMQSQGILPKTEDYSVRWQDLYATSDKDKADVGKVRADALKAYASEPMTQAIVPPLAFFEYFLGLSADEIELINEMMEAQVQEDNRSQETEQEDLEIENEIREREEEQNDDE